MLVSLQVGSLLWHEEQMSTGTNHVTKFRMPRTPAPGCLSNILATRFSHSQSLGGMSSSALNEGHALSIIVQRIQPQLP